MLVNRSNALASRSQLRPLLRQSARPMSMLIPALGVLGAILAAQAARQVFRAFQPRGANAWVKGGFKGKMDRSEAMMVLGLR